MFTPPTAGLVRAVPTSTAMRVPPTARAGRARADRPARVLLVWFVRGDARQEAEGWGARAAVEQAPAGEQPSRRVRSAPKAVRRARGPKSPRRVRGAPKSVHRDRASLAVERGRGVAGGSD
jgi:hypothetical protein